MADTAQLLLTLAAVAAGLGAAGWLSQRLRLPPALGYLAVGVVASSLTGRIPALQPSVLQPAADVAVLFLLFLIGLELDLARLRTVLARGALTLPFDVLVPALAITAVARLAGWGLAAAATLGICACLSSTLFGERLASGATVAARQRVLGILLAEDVAAGGLLATLAVLASAGAGWLAPARSIAVLVGGMVLLAAFAILVVPRILDAVARTHAHDLVVLVGASFVLLFGWAGHHLGSAELGALLAGVAAAEAGARFVVRNGMATLRDLALALFFLTAGLATNVAEVAAHPGLVLALAGAFLLAKLLVHLPAGIAAGLPLEESFRSAFALGTVGEFSLILAAEAARLGLAPGNLKPLVVGLMLLLLVASSVLARAAPPLARAVGRLPESWRRPARLALTGLRPATPAAGEATVANEVRLLGASLLLLGGWAAFAYAASGPVAARFPRYPIAASAALFGVAAAVGAPLVVLAYRRYRAVVTRLVARGVGNGTQAHSLRARLVDLWVAASLLLILVPLTLLAPRALPVLIASGILAAAIAAVAWRRLSRIHETVEATVGRVLGNDERSQAVLDAALERYPWGVRFAAVAVPENSPVANSTLRDSRLTQLTGATIAVVQRRGRETVNPSGDEIVRAGDTLVLMGDAHQLASAEALVVAHGEALRLTAQSRLAHVVEVPVGEGSSLVGARLGDANLRSHTGALVVGLWPRDAEHPSAYADAIPLEVGDRLILLGSPLQLERARLLAEGESIEETVESAPPEAGADVPAGG